MTTFKVIVEYDGTRYAGWQDQKNARTVMGELKKAAREVFGADVEMQGAGRTDAGVHALRQVMHVKTGSEPRHTVEVMRRRLNDLLPADIVILHVERTRTSFHARHDAVTRTYAYQISTRKQAFTKKYVWWVKEDLDLKAMAKAAAMLTGRHNFVCFCAEDPSKPGESTLVVVENAEIEIDEDVILFRIEASHFLWRMVRRIVGVLVKVGKGEVSEAEFRKLLEGQCDPKLDVAAWTAPASGLFLEHVRYGERK
ncbi:MAG TPA: tRNA pseudouridine(38-40) synthase TruA [Terriglobia bacterium]|nr:tRNA pseudouridine(38-40) synthase TruA [Terriglobia bacterium]